MTKTTTETTSDITTEITSSSEEKERMKKIIEYLTTCHYKENYIDKKPAIEMAKVFINAGLSLEQIKDKMENHIEALGPDDTIGWVVYCVCKGKLDPPKRATQQTTLAQDLPTFSEAAQALDPPSLEPLPPDPWRDALKELRDDPQVGHFHDDLFNCETVTENGRLIVQNIRPGPADWLNNRPAGELVTKIIQRHFGEVEVVFKPAGVSQSTYPCKP
jgi:hypothetical protein